MLASSRILAAAVSHEIRNVCAAMSVIHQNLIREPSRIETKDFEALGSLIETLTSIASLELRKTSQRLEVSAVDLRATLEDLRVVLEAYCEDAGISLHWNIPEFVPLVVADRHSLLQVLLNLTKNSERALGDMDLKEITFAVSYTEMTVSIRVTDTGPGIQSLEKLFQPFQKGADSTGLGLFLSRALLRSFEGDLRHDPESPGCSFVIDLIRVDAPALDGSKQREQSAMTSFARWPG
jgi:two-component system, LuxR family, sensor kinase FixL